MSLRAALSRRSLLLAAAGAAALATTRAARASSGSHLRAILRDARGTTLHLALDEAPYPAPGYAYRDDTVLAFVPHHYRYDASEGVQALVHFHGHNSDAERAMTAHELREQLFDSKQNAILVVPQLAFHSADSACGKLESPGGFARMLRDAIATLGSAPVRAALGRASVPAGAPMGTTCLSAHSGGYRAAACTLRAGGVEIHETYLFDALYSDADVFRDWVVAGKGRSMHERHKLVTWFTEGGTTAALSRLLLAALERAGVHVAREMVEGSLTREELGRAEAVGVRTGLAHGGVTYETNALRDCLFASSLTRRLRTAWFDHKGEARGVERRR